MRLKAISYQSSGEHVNLAAKNLLTFAKLDDQITRTRYGKANDYEQTTI